MVPSVYPPPKGYDVGPPALPSRLVGTQHRQRSVQDGFKQALTPLASGDSFGRLGNGQSRASAATNRSAPVAMETKREKEDLVRFLCVQEESDISSFQWFATES